MGIPRHADANYEQDDYEAALRTAAFLFDPAEPMDGSEFRRGVVSFLADAYAVTEMETDIRVEQVERDLRAMERLCWNEDPADREQQRERGPWNVLRTEDRATIIDALNIRALDRQADEYGDGMADQAADLYRLLTGKDPADEREDEDERRSRLLSEVGAEVTTALTKLYKVADGDAATVGECMYEIDKAARRNANAGGE